MTSVAELRRRESTDFSKKISKIKMIFWFDFPRCSHGLSKIRRHFRNKSRSILKLSKNVFYKKCGPKLILFNEIFFRKIRTFFDIENWLWKSDLGTFWRPMWTSVKVKSRKYFSFNSATLSCSSEVTLKYRLFFLRSIVQFFTPQIHMNCFFSS